MGFLLTGAIGALVLAITGWHVFEHFWDRSVFHGRQADGDFAINLSARKCQALLQDQRDVQVLDVRSAREAEASGVIPRATRLSFGDPDFNARVSEALDPSLPVMLYCAGGYRSRKAVPRLQEAGFQRIYHLHRGIIEWRMAGLPLMKADEDAVPVEEKES